MKLDEKVISDAGTVFMRERLREAGLAADRVPSRMSEDDKKKEARIAAQTLIYEHRLREGGLRAPTATTREIANADVSWLAAEGIPTVGGPVLASEGDLDGALMRGLQQDGIPMGKPQSVGRPRERLNMKLRQGQTSPEQDTDEERVSTPTSVKTGTDVGARVDCPNCTIGLTPDGTHCPVCRGVGFLLRADGETRAASAVQRLAESAVENAADLIGVPLKTDDLDGALATAIELGDVGDSLDARNDDGTWDMSKAPGVPMVNDGEATEPPAEGLIDLTTEVGVPNVKVPTRSAKDLLAEAEAVGEAA
jgi:hypothetical protein